MIYLAADHGGFALKERLKAWLTSERHPLEDLGPQTFDPNDDYPDFAQALGQHVGAKPGTFGVLLCRSGAGMVMAANRIKGVRAFVATDEKSVVHAREHNDANTIVLSADWINETQAQTLVQLFLSTPFTREERHLRRIAKLDSV